MTFPASALAHDDIAGVRDRFTAKASVTRDPLDCWEWIASRNKQGYGRFRLATSTGAHRIAYVLFVGDLPDGMTVDHRCGNRACVNPFHLDAVSIEENVMRGNGICMRHAAKERCPRGHEYGIRTRADGKTQRLCFVCDREYKREWARRKRKAAA